jgi:hypothetical protein
VQQGDGRRDQRLPAFLRRERRHPSTPVLHENTP